MSQDAADRLIVALDVEDIDKAKQAVESLAGTVRWFKVGTQLFTATGRASVELVKEAGCKAFLDLKFHDIPATVSKSVISATDLGVDLLNLHAIGGRRMMEAVSSGLEEHCAKNNKQKPKVIAVTVLTSLTTEELQEVGIDATPQVLVTHLASLARRCGLDGVVSSPEEIRMIKERVGEDTLVVTPGVRPSWAEADDQRRIKTPAETIEDGADYLVVGRPIMNADNRLDAAKRIIDEIDGALAKKDE